MPDRLEISHEAQDFLDKITVPAFRLIDGGVVELLLPSVVASDMLLVSRAAMEAICAHTRQGKGLEEHTGEFHLSEGGEFGA